MLVKEKRHNNSEFRCVSKHELVNNNNFIVLDDKTSIINSGIKEVIKLIETYGYKVDIVDMKKMAEIIINKIKKSNIEFDAILTVGTGGLQVFEQIKNSDVFKSKKVYNIKWNRVWRKGKSLGFKTDIEKYNINNKSILLLEDVIASGNTLWTLKEVLEKNNNRVTMICCTLIQESSPLINRSFCDTFSSMMICKPDNNELDVFWYPPIYSLRHLIFGDDEMDSFYETLNEKYFNNELKVEKLIKKIRG